MKKVLIVAALLLLASPVAAQPPLTPILDGLLKEVESLRHPAVPPLVVTTSPIVHVGESLQAAIDAAAPGATILVDPGTYPGITLKEKPGSTAYITVRPNVAPAAFPLEGVRMTPRYAPVLIKLTGVDGTAIRTAPRASYYRLIGIEVGSTGLDHSLVIFGSAAETVAANLPHHLILDRAYLHGDDHQWRGVELQCAAAEITNSHIDGILEQGRDAQAIFSHNGSGPFRIENNYLSASTETILFGGGDPSVAGQIPSDILIARNTITKDLAWRTLAGAVKNALELKNAQRVLIRDNIIEYAWSDGQSGAGVLFTVRNQDGHCPWCTVRDVEVAYNVVRHMNQGVNILGLDDHVLMPSVRAVNLNLHHNLFYDIGGSTWGGGSTKAVTLNNGMGTVTLDHNTFATATGSFLGLTGTLPGSLVTGLVITANILSEGAYGIVGDGMAPGMGSLVGYAPGAVFTGNVILQGPNPVGYPPGNTRTLTLTLDPQFQPPPTTAAGADIAALLARIQGLDLTK